MTIASNWQIGSWSPIMLARFKQNMGNLETVQPRRFMVQDMIGAWNEAGGLLEGRTMKGGLS